PDQTQAARFREVQQQCMSDIPRGGMVATTDIGAVHTIHPPDKKTVAKRLLYLAYARCYGYKGFECSGPVYKSMEIQGENIALSFDHAPYGVSSYGLPLAGFEIAGEDRIFHPAEAWLKGRSTVIVHSDEVKAPVAVRYCYKNYAYGNLYNNYGIVAPPFRTDDWNE
ncbi:MAG: sialate O-acetylesterase, partial [Alistipes sp.]|nr:sialate O-acetylesterase [Alistipes sp.]